jgi:hypothetical protein
LNKKRYEEEARDTCFGDIMNDTYNENGKRKLYKNKAGSVSGKRQSRMI